MQTEVIQTTHAGHALALLRRCSLHDQDGVVVVGGDGTLMEALNGLLTRGPATGAGPPGGAPLPIGVIPGQSDGAHRHWARGTGLVGTRSGAVAIGIGGCLSLKASIARITFVTCDYWVSPVSNTQAVGLRQ